MGAIIGAISMFSSEESSSSRCTLKDVAKGAAGGGLMGGSLGIGCLGELAMALLLIVLLILILMIKGCS